MKNFHLILAVLLFSGSAYSQTTITATVTNFENEKGICRACLFNNAEAFKGDGAAVQCIAANITGKSAQLVFSGVPKGTYAISVFHDANSNNKFDTNWIGIPKEGYGASGNNLPFAAAPTFNGNKFEVSGTGTTTLSIRLRYL